MINNYCENKSNKPVITKYDPSKNYMVQVVESLSSIDYPNENHIYVIESTGEKYIFYNGAFSKIEKFPAPLEITVTVENITNNTVNYYTVWRSSSVTFSSTYEEIEEAISDGVPITILYNGMIRKCMVYEEEGKITFDCFNAFLDAVQTPRYRTESFTIKSDETGSYLRTLISLDALDSMLQS